jgi:hypothetical protein
MVSRSGTMGQIAQKTEQRIFRVDISEKEKKLLDLIRSIGYGEIVILIQNMEPVRVEEVKKSIKL